VVILFEDVINDDNVELIVGVGVLVCVIENEPVCVEEIVFEGVTADDGVYVDETVSKPVPEGDAPPVKLGEAEDREDIVMVIVQEKDGVVDGEVVVEIV